MLIAVKNTILAASYFTDFGHSKFVEIIIFFGGLYWLNVNQCN